MRIDPMKTNDELKNLTKRVKYLEEISQSTLDVLDLMVDVSEQISHSPLELTVDAIFQNANVLIQRFLPLESSACHLVDEKTYAFKLHGCLPKSKRRSTDKEINAHIDDGTFSWATRQNRPVIVSAKHFEGCKVIFHSIMGKTGVSGMFTGIFRGKEPLEGGLFLDLFSIIMYHCSQSLENSKLFTALKNSERRYRNLADMLPQTVFETDQRGKIYFINRMGMQTFGLTKEHVEAGVNISTLFVVPDARRIRGILREKEFKEKNGNVEYTARRKDRKHFPALLYLSPVFKDSKKVGFRGILLDITERKKIETALYEKEAMARALLNATDDMAFLIRLDGSITEANKAAAEKMNITTDDMTGLNIKKVSPASMTGSRKLKLKEAIETGEPVRFVDERDQRIFDQVYYPVFNEKGKVSLMAIHVRDITEMVKAEEERRKLERELMEKSRLASIGLLTSGVAHNLRGPLAAMMAQIDLCEMDNPEMEEFKILRQCCENMNTIIDTMMLKTRREQEVYRAPIDLTVLLKTELSFLEADMFYKHKVKKKLELQENLPSIIGKYSDFSQALMNIVNNAMDAMHDSDEKRLTVTTESDENGVIVTVSDTGCGIPEEHIPNLFSPFFTTKELVSSNDTEKPRGTGLGLYSAYALLEPYNARIDIESKVGKGTTFKIRIPAVYPMESSIVNRTRP